MNDLGTPARSIALVILLIGLVGSACEANPPSAAETKVATSAVSAGARPTDSALATAYTTWVTKYQQAAAKNRTLSTRLKAAEVALASKTTGIGATPQQLAIIDSMVKLNDGAASVADTLAANAQGAATLHTQLAAASAGSVQ